MRINAVRKLHNTMLPKNILFPSKLENGIILNPNEIYLSATEEYTETHNHVPFLDGKSSVGRLGIDIHSTAGKGDVGFCNYWTLELSVKRPVRVYQGMPIGQLIYFKVKGKVITPYNKKPSSKYSGKQPIPVESMLWKEFQDLNQKNERGISD